MVDDQLSEKNPAFIPDLIDRRPEGAWRINASSAVLRLDVPMLMPDSDAALLELRPSYTDAMAKAPARMKVLPSINVIDGKAKQFDDGLFAAIDLAYYKGLKSRLESHVALIKRLHERVAPESEASAYLAAGLKIAGIEVKTGQPDQVASWLSRFESDAMYSKPESFYTWSEELTRVFRFMRFFQQPLPPNQPALISELARAVGSDPKLLEDYKRVNAFYARLTNPLDNLTLADVLERGGKLEGPRPIAVFPSSRSKETELFRQLFPQGLPPGADLMRELIKAIRKGKVDLAPKPSSGWYEYQIYALETFLLPEKGEENPKLLLTKAYKKRMLEAFQALMTKRRETHARDSGQIGGSDRGASASEGEAQAPRGTVPELLPEDGPVVRLSVELPAGNRRRGWARLTARAERRRRTEQELARGAPLDAGVFLRPPSAERGGHRHGPGIAAGRAGRSSRLRGEGRGMAGFLRQGRRLDSRYPSFGPALLRRRPDGEHDSGRRSACGWRNSTSLTPSLRRSNRAREQGGGRRSSRISSKPPSTSSRWTSSPRSRSPACSP